MSPVGPDRFYGLVHYYRALIITYTVLGVPYYNYSILGPKTLFSLLRPL